MKLIAIFLIALTTVCATPSIKYGKNHNRNPADGDDFKVPILDIDQNFQEILMKIEENEESDDNLNIPIDSPKDHMGLHYIDTLEEMNEIGINTQSIDPDIIEDAFLLVVSVRKVFFSSKFCPVYCCCCCNKLSVPLTARTYPKIWISS